MIASTHIKHETKTGDLTIVLDMNEQNGDTSERADRVLILQLIFEDNATGAFFDGEFTHEELCAICPIFHMRDEIPEILAEMPNIVTGESSRAIEFKYVGKKKEYNISLLLKPREYPADKRDIIELRAENAVLRRKIEQININLSYIAEILISDNGSLLRDISPGTVGNILIPMLRNKEEQLQKSLNIYRDIEHCSYEELQPLLTFGIDLRKFPQSEDSCILTILIKNHKVGPDEDRICDSRRVIELLIDLHVDVNHKHKSDEDRNWCNVCDLGHDSLGDRSFNGHTWQPLDVINQKISDSQSCSDEMIDSLNEIKQMLVKVGAIAIAKPTVHHINLEDEAKSFNGQVNSLNDIISKVCAKDKTIRIHPITHRNLIKSIERIRYGLSIRISEM